MSDSVAATTAPRPLPVVGQTAEWRRVVTDADIAHFGEATGDLNPLHFDNEFAARTRFGGRVAHGMLSAGLISAALANVLPGPGGAYKSQTLAFKLPVRPGDEVTVRLEVLELHEPKRRVRLSTVCANQRGEVVVEGEAWVKMLD